MRTVRTTITIERCRETVIREVLCNENAAQGPMPSVSNDRSEQADQNGSVIDVSPANEETGAEKLIRTKEY